MLGALGAWALGAGGLASLGLSACEGGTEAGPSAPGEASSQAARLADLTTRHATVLEARGGTPLFPQGEGYERACVADDGCTTALRLPASADEPTSLRETRSGVGAHFTLQGAQPSAAFVRGPLALYPDVWPGADVVYRATARGAEDFVHFARRPDAEVLRYDVTLEKVHALRLVGGVLELLDRKGAPRLRVARPYVIDADGERLAATLSVEGCGVDRDPRAPWSRPLDALATDHCVIVVDWSGAGATYPVLVDPEWQDAGNMVNARTHHSATFLPGVGILLAGGFDVDGAPRDEAELMCPAELCTFTSFSATDAMSLARGAHTATLLDDGDVLVAGGRNARDGGAALASTAIYDTAAGTFAAGPSMARSRDGHTATAVGVDAKVLVAGGDGLTPSTAEVFDGTSRTFAPAVAMTTRRTAHCAEALATPGVVLVAGGLGLQSAETYDAGTNTFTAVVGNMTALRAFATATRLEDGRILVTGGTNGFGIFSSTADIFDPEDNGGRFQQQPVVMEAPRAFHTATKLLGEPGVPGKVLLTGGYDGADMLAGSEVFDAEAVAFSLSSTMNKARTFHTATLLPSGQVLVAGGGYDLTAVDQPTATSTEILQRENGEPCAEGTECASGFCPGAPDGVCCDQPCEGTCESCGTGTCITVPDDTTVKPVCSDAVQFLLVCVDGEVSAGAVKTCDAFGCDGDACADACVDDTLCSEVGFCSGTTCLPKKAIGGSCEEDRQCLGGFCTDGVCCNARCGEQCQACDVEGSLGVCQQNEGPPRPGKPACDGAGGPCEGTCGSKPEACDYEPKACTQGSCSEGQLAIGRCHVETQGACTDVTEACEPFACNAAGDACAAECTTSAECAPGRACNQAGACVIVEAVQCDGDHIVVSPDQSTRDCTPFKCRDGACLPRCQSIDDCTAPSVCDGSGQCIDPPDDPAAPEGCAVGGRGNAHAAWLVVAALVAARRRRGAAQVSR